MNLQTLFDLWNAGADVPVDEDECIESFWAGFPPGTPREDVWHWFEAQHPQFVVGDLLQSKTHFALRHGLAMIS